MSAGYDGKTIIWDVSLLFWIGIVLNLINSDTYLLRFFFLDMGGYTNQSVRNREI
jgi:hypothetical protein